MRPDFDEPTAMPRSQKGGQVMRVIRELNDQGL